MSDRGRKSSKKSPKSAPKSKTQSKQKSDGGNDGKKQLQAMIFGRGKRLFLNLRYGNFTITIPASKQQEDPTLPTKLTAITAAKVMGVWCK